MSEKLMETPITWAQRMANLRAALGRDPTLGEMLDLVPLHRLTPDEIEAQRQSWVRAFTTPCEHGELDFEQCQRCRRAALGDAHGQA